MISERIYIRNVNMNTDLMCSFVWVRLLFKVVQAIKGMRYN